MENERISTIYIITIAFPLVFIIVAILMSFNVVRNLNALVNTFPVKATVVSVQEDGYWDSDDFYHYLYDTKVNYRYDGQEYRNISIGTLHTEYEIGESITIKINKDNPSSPDTTNLIGVVFPALVALVFGFFRMLHFL